MTDHLTPEDFFEFIEGYREGRISVQLERHLRSLVTITPAGRSTVEIRCLRRVAGRRE